MQRLLILIVILWMSGCTVHVHKSSCVGSQCSPPPVFVQHHVQKTVVAYSTHVVHKRTAHKHKSPLVRAKAHRHGQGCGHVQYAHRKVRRDVHCKQLNRTTKRCYATRY